MTKTHLGLTIIITGLFAAATTASKVSATVSSYSLTENLSKETEISVGACHLCRQCDRQQGSLFMQSPKGFSLNNVSSTKARKAVIKSSCGYDDAQHCHTRPTSILNGLVNSLLRS